MSARIFFYSRGPIRFPEGNASGGGENENEGDNDDWEGGSGDWGGGYEPGMSEGTPSLPSRGDEGLTGQDGGSYDLGPVGTSSMSLTGILSDRTDESVSRSTDLGGVFLIDGLTIDDDGFRGGRQSEPGGRSPGDGLAANAPIDRAALSVGRSFSAGAADGFGLYVSAQVSTAVGSGGSSMNSAQLFVGIVGLGIVAPTNPSRTVSFTYNNPNQQPSSSGVFSGCQPSAMFVTPFFSIQVTGESFADVNLSSISLSFGTAGGLGVFGGFACPFSLP